MDLTKYAKSSVYKVYTAPMAARAFVLAEVNTTEITINEKLTGEAYRRELALSLAWLIHNDAARPCVVIHDESYSYPPEVVATSKQLLTATTLQDLLVALSENALATV